MKKIILLLLFISTLVRLTAQDINYDNLDDAYKNVAIQAFAKVSPATKRWFADIMRLHPAGHFNVPWVNEKLRTHFTATDLNNTSDLFLLMMAYQKMLDNNAREDRKIEEKSKADASKIRGEKLTKDKITIVQQQKEASERQDNAMTSATTELNYGVISANQAIVAGAEKKDGGKTTTPPDSIKRITPIHLISEQPKPVTDQKTIQKNKIKKLQDQLAILKT